MGSPQKNLNAQNPYPANFNPQYQTSYQQYYLENANNPSNQQLAKPFKPDMNHVFRGNIDIGGGLSGTAGVGNLASTMQTSYQRNYSMI